MTIAVPPGIWVPALVCTGISPVGPVRLDVAKPIDNDAQDAVRLHVSMGLAL